MSEVLITFGILIVLVGLVAVVRPTHLLRLARKVTVGTWLRYIAFLIRAPIGVILILVAPSTGFPLTIKVIGTLLIVSGVAVLLVGNAVIERLLNWALELGPSAIVVGGLVGILFGAFLIYAGV